MDMSEPRHLKRQTPAWLVGLIIAIVLSVIVVVVARMLGYGDDPAIGALGSLIIG